MDRRRFFIGKNLNEYFSHDQDKYSLTEAFNELSSLYEEAKSNQTELSSKEIQKAEKVLTELKDSDYEDFVSILNSDGKSKAFLKYLKQHYQLGDDAINTVKSAGAGLTTTSCKALQPTQQNISLKKSLGMIDGSHGDKPIKVINTPTEAFATPTVTYAGKYIIDGHHRWSEAYLLNGGDCTISILDFPEIDGMTWEDMLKAAQLAIVATAGEDAELINDIPDDNLLKMSKDTIKKFFVDNASDEVVTAMISNGHGDSREACGNFISHNVEQMKNTNKPVAGAVPRNVMPQLQGENGDTELLQTAIINL